MKNIEHFGFIQFYTDNGSVEIKKTFVLVFFEALELSQKLVHMGFFSKLTIVTFSTQRVKSFELQQTSK